MSPTKSDRNGSRYSATERYSSAVEGSVVSAVRASSMRSEHAAPRRITGSGPSPSSIASVVSAADVVSGAAVMSAAAAVVSAAASAALVTEGEVVPDASPVSSAPPPTKVATSPRTRTAIARPTAGTSQRAGRIGALVGSAGIGGGSGAAESASSKS